MPTEGLSLAHISQFVGRETGVSGWMQSTQAQVDAFAGITDDHQWIHESRPATFAGPYKGPIAHALLMLANALKLAREAAALPRSTWIVYGYDKLRFRAPVRIGKRIRCRTTLLSACNLGGRVLLTVRFYVEIEHEKTPALVADCSLLCLDDEKEKIQT
jgi:acyl dehydratase